MSEKAVILVDNYKFTTDEAKLFRKMFVQLAVLYQSRKNMDEQFKKLFSNDLDFNIVDNKVDSQYIDNFLRKRINFKFDDRLFNPETDKLSLDNGVADEVDKVASLLSTWNARIDGLYITFGDMLTICEHYHVDRTRFKYYLESPNNVKESLIKATMRD